jgi:hypothetical protein
MASTFSPILRIELIGTGDQSGTWGDTTNINLGTLIEQAIAGTATIDVSVGNVTLSNFNGVTDQARCMALRVIGTPGTSRNVIAPAVSKFYIIANGSDAAVVLKTSVSTGLTVPVGEVYLAYYDTTSNDFRLVGRASASTNTANTLVLRDGSGNFSAGVITATGFTGPIGVGTPAAALFTTMSTSGNTIIGDASADTLTVNATPTFNVAIPVTSGGTGVTTSTGTGSVVRATSPTLVTPALGTPTSGNLSSCTDLPIIAGTTGTLSVARGGTGVTSSTGTGGVVLSDSPALTGVPTAPTAPAITNTTQIATTAFVQSVASTLGTMATQNANNVNISGGSITGITDLAVADGGTGVSTLTANSVLLGNGTSALQTVAPSTSGNVLTSNGTTWTSAAASPSIGVGQTWQNVAGSRASGTTYTNSTGKPIMVNAGSTTTGVATSGISATVGGVKVVEFLTRGDSGWPIRHTASFIVPNGNSYVVTITSGTLNFWAELR